MTNEKLKKELSEIVEPVEMPKLIFFRFYPEHLDKLDALNIHP